MIAMAKKPMRGRPPAPEQTTSVSFRATDSIIEALDLLALRNRRSRATEILLAVEAYLTAAGVWSPPHAAGQVDHIRPRLSTGQAHVFTRSPSSRRAGCSLACRD